MDDKILIHSKDICHHGVDGQKWGKRQYQYADGSLTPLGRVHYGVGEARERSKIKMREIRNETRNAIKLAKAQAKTAKAVAKAESQKLEAETKAYREKAEADNLVKLEKIRSEREKDRQQAKLAEQEAKNDAKLNAELAEATKENQIKESKYGTAAKTAIGILAAAGVGYLIYKACKSGETSAANREAGERVIEEISSRPVNQVVNSTATEVRNNVTANTHPYGFNNTGPSKWNVDSFTRTRASARQVARENKAVAKAAEAEANKLFRTRASAKQVAKENLNPDRYRYSNSPIKKLVEWGTGSKQQYNDILSKGFTPKEAYEMLGQKLPKYLRHSDGSVMILIHSANAPDIQHWGIKGQKKGYRRYQNEDGTLTEAGKDRYGVGDGRTQSNSQQVYQKQQHLKGYNTTSQQAYQKQQQLKGYNNTSTLSSKGRTKNVTGTTTGITKTSKVENKNDRSYKVTGNLKNNVVDLSRESRYSTSKDLNKSIEDEVIKIFTNLTKSGRNTQGKVDKEYKKALQNIQDSLNNTPKNTVYKLKDKTYTIEEFAKLWVTTLNKYYSKYKKNAKINGAKDFSYVRSRNTK